MHSGHLTPGIFFRIVSRPSCGCGWRGPLPEPSSSMVTSVKSRRWSSNSPSRLCPYCCVEEVGIHLERGLFISKCYQGGPRVKGRGKFLKYLFKEHPRCYTYGQAIRIPDSQKLPSISIYPHSASNMSVNAVLSIMQCGYPRATQVNFTRGGTIFKKIREKSYGLAPSSFKVSFSFG